MCLLVVLSLIEKDKQPLKPIFSILAGLGFLAAGAIYFPAQPIPLFEHWPGASIYFSPWIEQLMKLAVGAVVGAVLGRLFGRAFSASPLSILTFAYSLTGVVLGWQALLQVTVFFGLLTAAAKLVPQVKSLQDKPTTLLFVAVFLHHPFWQMISSVWKI